MTQSEHLRSFFHAFGVLGILPTLDADTIREAYRLAAQQFHPDKFESGDDKSVAHERFLSISKAKDFILETIQKPEMVDVFDTAPLTIGYEQSNGIMRPIFRIGTIVPCSQIQTVTIGANLRGEHIVELYQGVRPIARDNPTLCAVRFDAALQQPGFRAQLSVGARFEIDQQGFFKVSDAFDAETGIRVRVELQERQGGLSKHDIEAHIAHAQEYKASDQKRIGRTAGWQQ